MIQLFRQSNFLTSILLIPYTFLLRLPLFWLPTRTNVTESDGILFRLFEASFRHSPTWTYIATSLCIAMTAVQINRLIIKHRLAKTSSLLPGVVTILLSSWLPYFLPFTSILFANFFLVLAFVYVFSFSKINSRRSSVFDGAFFLSCSVLFYTPYIIFVIPLLLGYLTLDNFKFKDIISLLIGLSLPLYLLNAVLYLCNIPLYYLQDLSFNPFVIKIISSTIGFQWLPLIFYTILLVLCTVQYANITRKINTQIQKKIDIFFWLLLASFFTLIFNASLSPEVFLVLVFPLSAIIGLLWIKTNFLFVEEFLHIVAISIIILQPLFPILMFW